MPIALWSMLRSHSNTSVILPLLHALCPLLYALCFFRIARRSTFENVNILILLNRRDIVGVPQLEVLLDKLDHLCRRITNFQKTLVA